MEGLFGKFIVTDEALYFTVIEATENIHKIFGYKEATVSTQSIFSDPMYNQKLSALTNRCLLFYKCFKSDQLGIIVSPRRKGDTMLDLESVSIRLHIPERESLTVDGLKIVIAYPIQDLIYDMFGGELRRHIDPKQLKYFVAAIFAQFNRCDGELGVYPNVFMGFSVIISNFDGEYYMLPGELPETEYELKHYTP